MNQHINKDRVARQVINQTLFRDQFKLVERDTMPKEVATAMLCAPKARLTNRERKTFNDARATVYCATRTAIPEEEKVANKLKGRNWRQIHQQLRRVIEARLTAQRHFLFLQRHANKLDSRKENEAPLLALLDRRIAALNLHAAGLDALRDSLEVEIQRRQAFVQQLRELTPSLAKRLRRSLCGYTPR